MAEFRPVKGWTIELASILLRLGLIPDNNYTGKLNINLQDGGVRTIERTEVIK
jgi:hypothetical protein